MEKEEKTLNDHFAVSQKLLVIGFAIMLSAILFQYTKLYWVPWVIGFLVMIASVVYAAKYFRCPHCDSKLDPRRKAPNYCPNCGEKLV